MAKKKKAKRTAKKKTSQTRAKKKPSTKGTRKTAATKKTASRRTGSTSVDSLLKKFSRDRTQKETQLAVVIKKREELQTRTRKLEEQIAKVTQQQREIQAQLAQLDQQRDQEVKQLLAQLGINLESAGGSGGGQTALPSAGDRSQTHREHRLGTLTNGRDD